MDYAGTLLGKYRVEVGQMAPNPMGLDEPEVEIVAIDADDIVTYRTARGLYRTGMPAFTYMLLQRARA